MTPRIRRVLGGFHHRVANRLTGRQNWRERDNIWIYLPLKEAMAEALLQELETYVSCHQNIVTQFIVTRPVMDLCLAAECRMITPLSNRWWEQDGVGVEGMRTEAQEA